MRNEKEARPDYGLNEEGATIRRLVGEGKTNDDLLTSGRAAIRAQRLAEKLGLDLTNPIIVEWG